MTRQLPGRQTIVSQAGPYQSLACSRVGQFGQVFIPEAWDPGDTNEIAAQSYLTFKT